MCETERFKSIVRTLKLLFPDKEPRSIRIADLGCMEGGYSLELARCGYNILGIEARNCHLKKCSLLKHLSKLENLAFIQDDVRKIESHGFFEVIYASGILYHLDYPLDFLKILGKICSKVLILNTHYAEESIPSRFRHKLSKLAKHEGMWGRWYEEWPKGTSREEVEHLERNSVGNYRSFWLRKDSLLMALRQAGFNLVFEQYDCHYDMEKALQAIHRNSRGLFVAIKK